MSLGTVIFFKLSDCFTSNSTTYFPPVILCRFPLHNFVSFCVLRQMLIEIACLAVGYYLGWLRCKPSSDDSYAYESDGVRIVRNYGK
jgi:hypothetical protein